MTQDSRRLSGIVADLAGARVAVVGDVMLDHYVSGAVARVSDEAPVPILRVDSERWVLGGAANVAANIAALGGRAALVGLVGEDEDAGRLRAGLAAADRDATLRLVADPGRPTVRKTRYMGSRQQMLRVDREDFAAISDAAAHELIQAALAALSEASVMVLSDYGKGVLSERVLAEVLDAARAAGTTVVVDPKRSDYRAYRGAAYVTPNRRELTLASGLPCETDAEAQAAAAAASAAAEGAAILLTRSEKGMALFRPDAPPVLVSAQAREVFDVSGAGDTVVAAFALSLAAGLAVEDALGLANAAAGVVVEKQGTAVVTAAELRVRLDAGPDPMIGAPSTIGASGAEAAPVLDWAGVSALRAAWARAGLSVGFANGCFDLLHPGHVSLIAQAAAACDRLIVALNSDASTRRLKGPSRPVQEERARAAVMAGLKGVAAVVVFDEDTPERLIEALVPDVLVKGADYAGREVVGAAFVEARGGRVLLAELSPGQSTTALIGRAGPG